MKMHHFQTVFGQTEATGREFMFSGGIFKGSFYFAERMDTTEALGSLSGESGSYNATYEFYVLKIIVHKCLS